MPAALPDRVLVVRLGAIGDVTNALVLATAIKAARPDVRLGWAVHPLARPLVEGHPAIDRVHVWERGSGRAGFRRLVEEIRAESYGLAVDLQRIQKSSWLARRSGAPRVLGYDRRRAKELSWLWTTERIPPGHPRASMLEQYIEFVRHLGLDPTCAVRELPRDAEAEGWAEARIADWGGRPLVVHVGATKPLNRWEPRRYGELLAALDRAQVGPLVLTGGPADRDDADLALGVPGARCEADLVGRTSLAELIALLRRARGFVGCDTGPMHLAAAVDTPVVALFGPADPLRTGPQGEGHVVLRVPPAGEDRAVALPPADMHDVGVDLVTAAVLERLLN